MFKSKPPGLERMSIGPELAGVYTCCESVSISSTRFVWNFLTKVLRRSR